jgi:hypothetical protein
MTLWHRLGKEEGVLARAAFLRMICSPTVFLLHFRHGFPVRNL